MGTGARISASSRRRYYLPKGLNDILDQFEIQLVSDNRRFFQQRLDSLYVLFERRKEPIPPFWKPRDAPSQCNKTLKLNRGSDARTSSKPATGNLNHSGRADLCRRDSSGRANDSEHGECRYIPNEDTEPFHRA